MSRQSSRQEHCSEYVLAAYRRTPVTVMPTRRAPTAVYSRTAAVTEGKPEIVPQPHNLLHAAGNRDDNL